MKTCANCGNKYPSEKSVCPRCGSALVSANESNQPLGEQRIYD